MLVIRRKRGQAIYIDDGRIVVELIETGVRWAKIGITAPDSVSILRDDLVPDGSTRCCRCGGTLPPAGPDGGRVVASTGCRGEADPVNGRCPAFGASKLWEVS